MTRAERKGKGFWGWSRRIFRWCRISVWLVILLIALAFLYLNKVGLPKFIKTRVVAAIEAQGLNVEFTRLRLRGYRQIVIDQMRLNATNASTPLLFEANLAELQFNREQLHKLQFQLEALNLEQGRLTMDLKGSNAFVVDHIRAQLRVEPQDRWTLRQFEGEALGARWRVSGSLTNLLALRAETAREKAAGKKNADWTPALRDIVDTIEHIQFSAPPEIYLAALGDLRDLARFKASIVLRAPAAKTPWGDAQGLTVRSAIAPSARAGEQIEADVNIKVASATTPWGKINDAVLLGQAVYPLTNSAAFESAWSLKTDSVQTEWFSGKKIEATLNTRQAGTNLLTLVQASAATGDFILGAAERATFQARLEHAYPVLALNHFLYDLLPGKPALALPMDPNQEILTLGQHWSGDWRLALDNLRTRNGAAGKFSCNGDVRERTDPVRTDASWGSWRNFASLLIDWRAEATDFRSGEARLERVAAAGSWKAPAFAVTAIDSQLYGGSFHLDGILDVPSRQVSAETRFNFDLKQIAWLFDPEVRPAFDQFTWDRPPEIQAKISFTAPPWQNPPKNWPGAVMKSAALDGSFAIGTVAYRGVSASALRTHFTFANSRWRLPDLVLARPEGAIELDYSGSVAETAFRLGIRGGIDPAAAAPLLEADMQEAFKQVQFPLPPFIEGTLSGDLKRLETLRFEGSVAVSNIVIRGEPFVDAKARIGYSNFWIYLEEPIAHRTTNEVLMASVGSVDLKRLLMYVTNGFSTTDPYRFTKILGPKIEKAIAPYKFAKPPTVRAEGTIPLEDENDADIRFQITGDEFAYWRFNMTKAQGVVYWHHQFLDVTNFTANFYGGDLDWEGHFIFRKGSEADYRFKGVITNSDLGLMLHDLVPGSPNKLDGTVHGTLVVTDAKSESLQSWQGHGEAVLQNGFLWDIPIFGIFSKPLDAVAPGFGRSRIYSGKGTFRIEDGKVYTKDMEVRAPAFRLRYNGSVDFDGGLDAKVEAELFRDAWVIGKAFSTMFWPLAKAFESKVTGNLAAPKSEFAHIPKIILFPLRPIQTLKELIPKEKEKKPETAPAQPPAPDAKE